MTAPKKLLVFGAVAASAAFAWLSLPPPPGPASGEHGGHGGDPSAFSSGTVLAVDHTAKSITISHGPLQNLGMPPMTMEFQVKDPAMLVGLKPGDKVRFQAGTTGGAFTVTRIEVAN